MGGGWVAALTVRDDFGSAPQRAHLGYASDVASIPFQSKLEVLVGIHALCVDAELGHGETSLARSGCGGAAAMSTICGCQHLRRRRTAKAPTIGEFVGAASSWRFGSLPALT